MWDSYEHDNEFVEAPHTGMGMQNYGASSANNMFKQYRKLEQLVYLPLWCCLASIYVEA